MQNASACSPRWELCLPRAKAASPANNTLGAVPEADACVFPFLACGTHCCARLTTAEFVQERCDSTPRHQVDGKLFSQIPPSEGGEDDEFGITLHNANLANQSPGTETDFTDPAIDEASVSKAAKEKEPRCHDEGRQTKENCKRILRNRFEMGLAGSDLLGNGSSSTCWRGLNLETEAPVAIKVYNQSESHCAAHLKSWRMSEATEQFTRQVKVLEDLQRPFVRDESALWHESFEHVLPSDLFVCLVDYTKGTDGLAQVDDSLYIVTEIAQYSLRDYLHFVHSTSVTLTIGEVWKMTKSLLLVVAGLHIKEYVHADLKPDNFMVFGSKLKLIDVDGCSTIGNFVVISDEPISFSACYCAPEWAALMADAWDTRAGQERPIFEMTTNLDAWSIGMTLCEFVVAEPVLKSAVDSFIKDTVSFQDGSRKYMQWFGNLDEVELPTSIQEFDSEYYQFIRGDLLCTATSDRRAPIECLSHASMADLPAPVWPSDVPRIPHPSPRPHLVRVSSPAHSPEVNSARPSRSSQGSSMSQTPAPPGTRTFVTM